MVNAMRTRETVHRASTERRSDRARRVADVLRGEVQAGRLPGRMLPAEARLARDYGVSRNAVRAALDLLRREGLVERIPGTGTRAGTAALPHGIDHLRGLGEAFAGQGAVRNEVLLSAAVPAPVPVAARLDIAPGSQLVCLERLRLVDDRPLSIDLTFVVPDLGEQLLGCNLVGQDVFVLLERIAGQPLGLAELGIEAVAADPARAALLEVPVGAPLLMIERLTRLDDRRPVDLEFIRMRGDRVRLRGTAARPQPDQFPTTPRGGIR
jgi:GntR family transcriptional regulator